MTNFSNKVLFLTYGYLNEDEFFGFPEEIDVPIPNNTFFSILGKDFNFEKEYTFISYANGETKNEKLINLFGNFFVLENEYTKLHFFAKPLNNSKSMKKISSVLKENNQLGIFELVPIETATHEELWLQYNYVLLGVTLNDL